MLMIDTMAERYAMLPSEVLTRGNTMDLLIFDACSSYKRHLQDRANGAPLKTEDFNQDELKQIMEDSRNGRKNRRRSSS